MILPPSAPQRQAVFFHPNKPLPSNRGTSLKTYYNYPPDGAHLAFPMDPQKWVPPPFDINNPRPMIVIPDTPSFDRQDLCDDTGLAVAIGVRSFLKKRNNAKPPPPGDQDLQKMDDEFDDQICLNELDEEIGEMDGTDLFPGTDNSDTRLVIRWTKMKRNATQYNDLPLLNSQLHYYLSAAAILMGPSMLNCPESLASVIFNLNTVQLQPLSLNALPKLA